MLPLSFEANKAIRGGAIDIHGSNSANIHHNTFKDNKAERGAAIDVDYSNDVTVAVNTFDQNQGDKGGAIAADWGKSLSITGNTLKNNTATDVGSNLFIQSTSGIAKENSGLDTVTVKMDNSPDFKVE